MSEWTLDRNRTFAKMGLDNWFPKFKSIPECPEENPQVVYLKAKFEMFTGMDVEDIRHEIEQTLRTPWDNVALSIRDENDKVLVTEEDFSDWLTTEDVDGTILNTARTTKPSGFVATYPTWNHKGTDYTTDVYSAIFGKAPKLATERHGLDRSITFTLSARFHYFNSDDKVVAFPAAQDLLLVPANRDLATYGLTTQNADPYSMGWNSEFTIQCSADSEDFNTDSLNMARCIKHISVHGVRVPFDLSLLPHESTGRGVALALYMTIQVADIFEDSPHIRIPCTFNFPFASMINQYNFQWSLYIPSGTHSTSCIQHPSHGVTPVYDKSRFLIDANTQNNNLRVLVDNLIVTFTESTNGVVNTSILDDMMERQKRLELSTFLLSYPTNQFKHNSEGFLMFLEERESTIHKLTELLSLNIISQSVHDGHLQTLDEMQIDKLKKDAEDFNIYKEDYWQAKRPLYLRELEKYNSLQQKVDSYMDEGERPPWQRTWNIVAIVLSAILLVMIVLLAYALTKRYRRGRSEVGETG